MSIRAALLNAILVIVMALVTLQAAVVVSSAVATRFRRRRDAIFPNRQPARLSEVGEENEVTLYTYGMDLYDAMLDDIRSATRSICIESFIWKGDSIGSAFKEAIIEKAKQGVEVFVIFDSFANMVVPRAFKLFPNNIHIYRYRAWRQPLDIIDPRRLARDHRKLLIVDERIGYLGGYNIGDLYGAKWRDTHVRIEGAAARQLHASFVDFWTEHAGSAVRPKATEAPGMQPHVRLYINNPTRIMFPIRSMYIEAIDLAKDHVLLTTPYFVPDRFVLESLVRAAKRGVSVQLLVPEQSNHLLADWLARTYFTKCLRRGIRIFLYQGAMIHAKTATIDGEWTTVGTANLDRLSLMGNHEVNVEFFGPQLARQMEDIFIEDRSHCRELLLHEWLKRPLVQKLGELVLSPYWPFL